MGKLEINRKLLPMKAHYFLFNAGTAPLMPFIPVYAKQLGVPQTGVGVMYMILPFVGLLAKPTFGIIADKFRIGKIIFITAIALTAIFFSSICFIPGKPTEAVINFDCAQAETLLKTCDITDNCTLERINLENDQSVLECKLQCDKVNSNFLDEMCHKWNILDGCVNNNNTSMEFVTHTNMSKADLLGSCLFFPIESLHYQLKEIKNPRCDNFASMKCNVVCDSLTVMSYIQKPVNETGAAEEPYYSTLQFQMLFGLMVGSWAAQSVVVSLSDSICFSLLGNKPHDYGVQRLWGALGWGLFAIISGYLIDLASIGKQLKDYTPSFYLIVILLTLNILSVFKIKIDYHQEPMIIKKVLSLFNNLKVVLFLLSCISFGICIALIWQFLFWHLEDLASVQGCSSLQWIKLLEGLAMGIQCFAGEAPFLFLSGWFLNKLGHVTTMTMILVVMGIRLLAYSFLSNPWYALPIELLNGLTLGVYWSTMASYAYLVAPPGAASTLQGIFGALFEGIGTSIGSLLGGFIFQNYGGVVCFRAFGTFAIIIGVLFWLTNFIIDYLTKTTRKESVAGMGDYSSEALMQDGPCLPSYGSLESYSRVNCGPKDDPN